MFDNLKRVTVVTGHYGCGKTNFAINLALWLKDRGEDVAVIDLDIVNPYFRTAEYSGVLEQSGVRTVNPNYANSALDVPSLPRGIAGAIGADYRTVIDLGGDDVGARALGRFKADIESAGGADMLYLFSRFRPFTTDAKSVCDHINEIEIATRQKVTGLVNSTNIGPGTTREDITDSLAFADEVAAAASVPLVCTLALRPLAAAISGSFPVDLFVRPPWERQSPIKPN